MIFLNIKCEFKRIIAECTNAVEEWRKIRLNFYPDSQAFHMKAFTDLIECRKQENESIYLFATRFPEVAECDKRAE